MNNTTLAQFDQIEILTTKRVSYLSNEPGHVVSPHGTWCVVGFIEGDVLAAKETALIRIPFSDVRKSTSYDPHVVLELIGNLHGKNQSTKDQRSQRGNQGGKQGADPRFRCTGYGDS